MEKHMVSMKKQKDFVEKHRVSMEKHRVSMEKQTDFVEKHKESMENVFLSSASTEYHIDMYFLLILPNQ
jgi:hypothetical protein